MIDAFLETILISQQQGTHLLDLHAASIKYVRMVYCIHEVACDLCDR